MIDSEYAGVAFSQDPMGSGTIVVEYVKGFGDSLVSGKIQPTRYYFKRGGKINDFKNLNRVNIKNNKMISDTGISKIAKLTVELESMLNFSTDIEWAQDKSNVLHLFVLKRLPHYDLHDTS